MKKVIITAVFTGANGSCGYNHGNKYTLDVTMFKGYILVANNDKAIANQDVSYGSIFAMLGNWSDIQVIEHTTETRELTFGEKAAGITFNPGGHEGVNVVKRRYADIIDLCNDSRGATSGEQARYYSKAISEAENSQMNSVKAITWNS